MPSDLCLFLSNRNVAEARKGARLWTLPSSSLTRGRSVVTFSSHSNHALTVQTDAFFISGLEILKTLTQGALSRADVTSMPGQGGAGQKG